MKKYLKKLCTLLTLVSVILAALFALMGAPWWLTGGTAFAGVVAFLLNSWLRKHFRTVTRPMTLQRDYRAGWLLIGGSTAVLTGSNTVVIAVATVLGIALVFAETNLAPSWGSLYPSVRNLPGAEVHRWIRTVSTAFILLSLLATLALFTVPAIGVLGAWIALTLNGAAALLAVGTTAYARRRKHPIQDAKWQSVANYAPQFIVYFSAPAGSAYQIKMWVPFLERVGLPWMIVLRERRYLREFSQLTDVPVVVASSLGSIDQVMTSSVRAVFYVNNSFKNSHAVRFADRTHVQLLHGDSDKVSSFSPVTAMYDRVFVAGAAGRDRYWRHGIAIPEEKFRIVGRPQVEGIQRAEQGPSHPPVVLYAPTWHGFQQDANFSSLPVGEIIVRTLMEAGCRVIFRAHPSSMRQTESVATIERIHELLAADTGTDHIFGQRAQSEVDLVDCMNASDALITDVSSVPGDYLFSDKPFITVKTLPEMDDEEFASEFPLVKASYVWDSERPEELFRLVEQMLSADPLAPKRSSMRSYYLGDFEAEGYAEHFLSAVRRVVAENEQSALAQ